MHDPDEQIPFDADLPTGAPTKPATITVLGRVLPLRSPECYRENGDGFWLQVWFSDGTWTVLVMSESYPRVVEVRVSETTLADAERVWLEYASLEAPRLCALVVDGMATATATATAPATATATATATAAMPPLSKLLRMLPTR